MSTHGLIFKKLGLLKKSKNCLKNSFLLFWGSAFQQLFLNLESSSKVLCFKRRGIFFFLNPVY